MQGGRVVDAVAHVADDVAGFLQREDDPFLLVRIDLRKDSRESGRMQQRLVAHAVHLTTGHAASDFQSHRVGDVARDLAVVAGDDLEADAALRQVEDGLAHIGFGRIEEQQETGETQILLVGARVGTFAVFDGPRCDAEHAITLAAPRVVTRLDLRAQRGVERHRAGGGLHARANREDVVERALGYQGACARRIGRDHGQALAHEVVRNLVDLVFGTEVDRSLFRAGVDRIVERIGKPGLEACVDGGEAQHGGGRLARNIERAVEFDHARGQRAGLVGAQHVHAAEVLDRVQPPHDHAELRHALGAVRQGDADDRGQQFRREAHRKREREQQRCNRRLVHEDVDGQYQQHHHQHDPRQQVTESFDAAFELGQRRAQRELVGDLPEHGRLAGPHDEHLRGAAAHAGPHENAVAAFGEGGIGRDGAGLLFDRECFSGEHRLIDEEVLRDQHHAVGRNQAAGGELHDVARHHVRRSQRQCFPAAQHIGVDGDLRTQFLDRVAGDVFLDEAEDRAAEHDGQYDARVDPFGGHQRNRRREDQDQYQRTLELVREQSQRARLLLCIERVGAVALEPQRGLGWCKPAGIRMQRGD